MQRTWAKKRWSTLGSSLYHQSWPTCLCKPHIWYKNHSCKHKQIDFMFLNKTTRTEYERTIHHDLGWCSGRVSLSSSMLSRSSSISSHTTVWLSRSTFALSSMSSIDASSLPSSQWHDWKYRAENGTFPAEMMKIQDKCWVILKRINIL